MSTEDRAELAAPFGELIRSLQGQPEVRSPKPEAGRIRSLLRI
jgi:hypothetical protein